MSRFFAVLLNLRIGAKLAITSIMSIALVGAMIFSQISGNGAVRTDTQVATAQQMIAALAADAKSAARGLQIGVRDIRLARTNEDMQRAADYLAARQATVVKQTDAMIKIAQDPENRKRMEDLKSTATRYVEEAKAIQTVRTEAIGLAGPQADTARIASLNEQAARIARERTLPLAAEVETLANKISEVAQQRTEVAVAKAAQAMEETERTNLIIGAVAALLLIGTAVFSVFTIARPMKALTGGMLELADGNFDVVLPGLGRKDEIGDVAAAVETFKVKSAEKARLEAEAKAELDRKALAEKAERDRIEAEQKVEADKRAAAEREAATAKVMSEFDAAVGGIVKAAMA
ncbi:MAG TPA: HAMP domain-containing protein, partial [Xanthobacteraceae bacterium]|nr:HAMP domain-containing protein [Xanthobacteraceae bacterium]